ncbi:MAG: hypothetical protein LUO85_05540 [Methanomassiliicoccales archaeon]|nr:hypothetical protein [Methanomassiliicoccales archaeon]
MESGFAMISNGSVLRWYKEAKDLHEYVQLGGEVMLYGGFGPRLLYLDAHRCLKDGVITMVTKSTSNHSDAEAPQTKGD